MLDSTAISILQTGRRKSNVADFDEDSSQTPTLLRNGSFQKIQKLAPCDYVIEGRLGHGSFGEVFSATSARTQESVALKKIPKNSTHFNKRSLSREIQAGNRLKHDGIVQFKTFFETENSFYLVYERLRGMDLYTLMKERNFIPLKETEVMDVLSQLISALIYCHNQDTCHRDVKWENVFLTEDGTVKLIDFGLSAHISPDDDCHDFVGSPYFAAPEIVSKRPYSGFKADVYSCGIVLYGLLYGRLDIRRSAIGTILWPDKFENDFPFFVTRAAKDLLASMLEEDPVDRISLEQVLKHRWFQQDIKTA